MLRCIGIDAVRSRRTCSVTAWFNFLHQIRNSRSLLNAHPALPLTIGIISKHQKRVHKVPVDARKSIYGALRRHALSTACLLQLLSPSTTKARIEYKFTALLLCLLFSVLRPFHAFRVHPYSLTKVCRLPFMRLVPLKSSRHKECPTRGDFSPADASAKHSVVLKLSD
jgi:hypothetical protein